MTQPLTSENPFKIQEARRKFSSIEQHGRSSRTCSARAEEAYGYCHHGAWTWGQVYAPLEYLIRGTALTSQLAAEQAGMSKLLHQYASDKPFTPSRVSLAENWRRRGKFEEVAFIFPNAPHIPITVVSLMSIKRTMELGKRWKDEITCVWQ